MASGSSTASSPDEGSQQQGESVLFSEMEAELMEVLKRPPDSWQLLPAEAGYPGPLNRFFRHRRTGLVLTATLLAVDAERHWARFCARPTDVIVASFPKSGTTWLQRIVWLVVHGEAGDGHKLTQEFSFPFLDAPSVQGRMEYASLGDMPDPRLIKTHLPVELLPASVFASGAKVLHISRDPRDVCVSYYHFSRMLNYLGYRGSFEAFRNSFVRGVVVYGPYREHVRGYLKRADTILCVSYEELHRDRTGVVRKVAEFLGIHLTEQRVEDIVMKTSFEAMRTDPSCNFRHWEERELASPGHEEGTFMRKGVVGDWRNYFTDEESDRFMQWVNGPL